MVSASVRFHRPKLQCMNLQIMLSALLATENKNWTVFLLKTLFLELCLYSKKGLNFVCRLLYLELFNRTLHAVTKIPGICLDKFYMFSGVVPQLLGARSRYIFRSPGTWKKGRKPSDPPHQHPPPLSTLPPPPPTIGAPLVFQSTRYDIVVHNKN